ncbi:radical SAM protein [Candidatus Woesearchaeota archaeon]|nr:radical SAM protein [Candidatus Woesearchaeota archaeon]
MGDALIQIRTGSTNSHFARVQNRSVRVLLINTPFRDMYGPIKIAAGVYFPLALGSVAAYCLQKGHEVKLIDPEPQGYQYSDMKRIVEEYQPDIIGMTCATPNFNNALKIAAMAKEVCGAMITIGGVHVSSYPEPALRAAGSVVDAVILREGEEQMEELCQYLLGNVSDLSSIKGIAFRTPDGKVINNGIRPFIEDMDSLPFPAYHLVDLNLYKPNVYKAKGTKTASVVTSRGCPAFCVFCASHKTLGRGFRAHSAEYVIRLVEYLVNEHKVDHVSFEDDVFTLDLVRCKKFCNLMIEKGLNKKVKWACFSRVVGIDEELFSLMKQAGCYAVSMGCESGDDLMLQNMKKGTTVELNRRAIELCHKVGLRSIAFFVFGTPGETKESIERTIQFALTTRPTMAFFNVLSPYPGTELFDYSFTKEEQDKIQNWEDFVSIGVNPQLKHSNLTQDELQKAAADAFRRFYFNPRGVYNVMRSVSTLNEFKELGVGAYGLCLQIGEWMRRVTLTRLHSSDEQKAASAAP